ncbi:MAG: histidinol-phosphate transaminase, partial [Candidatus Dadabacteria bacterium]
PGYTHDLKDMYSRITPKTKAVFIANPNNPTGTMVAKDEMEWFLDKIDEDILVVIDEAYFEYVDNPSYPDSLDYMGLGKSILTVRTFSKIYGLAGMRLGYGIGPEGMVSNMHKARHPFNTSSLAQVAAIAALDDAEHVRKSKEMNSKGLDYLGAELGRLGVEYAPSHTNFILVNLGGDPMPVYNALLREGVIVRPVGIYGLKTHLRVSVGLQEENERFISAFKKVLGK